MTTDLTIFDDFGKPLAELTLDELTRLGTGLLNYAQFLGKRTALMTYEAGRVLCEIKARLKEDAQWEKWMKAQRLPRSTVRNVIALYERVQDKEKLQGLTIMDAYRRFGVLAPRKNEQKTLPPPGDETAAEQHRTSAASPVSMPSECVSADSAVWVGDDSDAERADDEGDEVIDVPLSETITVDKATLKDVVKDVATSVALECIDELKSTVFDHLEVTDEEIPLADAALGGLLQGKPIQADARFEVLLDKIYSAILEVQNVGLRGSAKETAWLFEKLVLAAQGRLQHV
jgi:hypothetical protein